MTRAELAKKIGLDDGILKLVFEAIKDEVKAGGKVDINSFGQFVPVEKAARTARNPRTGATVQVAAKKSVKFKPSKPFKDSLN